MDWTGCDLVEQVPGKVSGQESHGYSSTRKYAFRTEGVQGAGPHDYLKENFTTNSPRTMAAAGVDPGPLNPKTSVHPRPRSGGPELRTVLFPVPHFSVGLPYK
jgi:hypothetical protein